MARCRTRLCTRNDCRVNTNMLTVSKAISRDTEIILQCELHDGSGAAAEGSKDGVIDIAPCEVLVLWV
jgi:hypothetical protein